MRRNRNPVGCWLIAALLLSASLSAIACPLCLGAFQLTVTAQDLVSAERAVLAVPNEDRTQLRVVAVIKGEGPPAGIIEAKSVLAHNPGPTDADTPRLLLRDRRWQAWANFAWANFGTIGVEHAEWLRALAATT